MLYAKNREVLTQVVAERASIRNVSKHRKPDGSFDIEGNLKLWNTQLARFEAMPLWPDGAPGYDDRDPLQPQPSIVFIPAPQGQPARGTVVVAHGAGGRAEHFGSAGKKGSHHCGKGRHLAELCRLPAADGKRGRELNMQTACGDSVFRLSTGQKCQSYAAQ